MALTSQITTSLLQVDGRMTEGGVIEIVPGARLLLDVGVENIEPGALLDEIAAAVAEAKAARDEAVDLSSIATPDALVASLQANPATATGAGLAATIVTLGDARYSLAVNAAEMRTLDDWAATGTGHWLHGVSTINGLNVDPAGALVAVENAIASHPGEVVMIDLDYRRTSDGVLVSMHDATTVNLSPTVVTTADVSFRDLPPIDRPGLYGTGWNGTPIGRIEDILLAGRGRCVFVVEIKDGISAVPEAIGLGARLGMLDKIVWATGDPTVVAAIVAQGGYAMMFNCNTTAKLDQAAAAGAWLVDVPTDASTAFIDYATSRPGSRRHGAFARIVRGFINTAGTPIVTDRFSQVTSVDPRLDGFSSDSTGYLDRPGGQATRSRKSIAGSIRTGKRGPGWWIVNSSNITNWLEPTRLYTYRAGTMVYTFGDLAGTIATTGTITLKMVMDTLPSTLSQSTRLKLFSPTEHPANASANTVEGYVLIQQADGAIGFNSVPVGGGSPAAVHGNLASLPLVAGQVATLTVEWDDTSGAKVRTTRQDATATLSGAVSAGTVTSLPINALGVALANGARLLLPDGTQVTVNGAHAAGVTTLTVQSVAVPALSSGNGLRSTSGWVTEGALASWRGKYHSAYSTQTAGVGAITDLSIA